MRMRVSLCMIARDEAKNLPGCLASVADLADEVIVVDTGSTDRTREVARELGARVVDFAWIDDFAAARNESIRHATGDWILWLDADERLDPENRETLRALLAAVTDENATFVMKQRSMIDPSNGQVSVFEQPRLFRNRPDVRWCYRVHEQILPALERSGSVPRFTDVEIDHFGYTDPAGYRLKQERNLRLLLRQDAERPGDSLTAFNLGLTLLALGRKPEAVAPLRKSLDLAPPAASWTRKLYALLSGAANDPTEALDWCRRGLTRFPGDTELLFLEANLLASRGDLSGAEADLRTLLGTPDPANWAAGVDPAMRGHKAQHNLAMVLRAQGRPAEAEALWRSLLDGRPGDSLSLLGLGELLAAQGRPEDLEPLIGRLEALPGGSGPAARLRSLAEKIRSPTGPPDGGPSYDRKWYEFIDPGASRSAGVVVPIVLELLGPTSVVDVGCGAGSWLSVFREHGIADLVGVDGESLDLDLLKIPREQFRRHDLSRPLHLGRRFDLAVALEVAEHLPPESAEGFVGSLVGLAPAVLFSAALPFQGGNHHVNERWPAYWIDLFERRGYLAIDCVRRKVWLDDRVDWWYRQNMLLFCSPTLLVGNESLRRELADAPDARLPIVHPDLFLQHVEYIRDLNRQIEALRPGASTAQAPG